MKLRLIQKFNTMLATFVLLLSLYLFITTLDITASIVSTISIIICGLLLFRYYKISTM